MAEINQTEKSKYRVAKLDIAKLISFKEGINYTLAYRVVSLVFEHILLSAISGKVVYIRNFGNFYISKSNKSSTLTISLDVSSDIRRILAKLNIDNFDAASGIKQILDQDNEDINLNDK